MITFNVQAYGDITLYLIYNKIKKFVNINDTVNFKSIPYSLYKIREQNYNTIIQLLKEKILNDNSRYKILFESKNELLILNTENKKIAYIEDNSKYGILRITYTSNNIYNLIKSTVQEFVIDEDDNILPVDIYVLTKEGLDYYTVEYSRKYDFDPYYDIKLFKLTGIDVEQLAREFLYSGDSILLLYGPPGIGKSKLVTALLFTMNKLVNTDSKLRKTLIVKYFKGKRILDAIQSNPVQLLPGTDTITVNVFDDIEYHKLTRDTNDIETKEFVNFLLSLTDGILLTNRTNKFIITTNQELGDIDRALLRPGRLFDAITLNLITYDKLAEYNKQLADECKNVYNKNEFTVAEVGRVLTSLKNNTNTRSYIIDEELRKKTIDKIIKLGF